MDEHVLYLGYWYQRTSLHLSEVYDYLKYGRSPLQLNKQTLHHNLSELDIKNISFHMDSLEYVLLDTNSGITVRFYEDGLVIMKMKFENINSAKKTLSGYYEQKFLPAISYLFSLGAPVPKELLSVKNTYPYFLITQNKDSEALEILLKELGEKEYFEFINDTAAIFRGDNHFVINCHKEIPDLDNLVEMFIFFSEFKAQLHNYLNLHRNVWEKIEKIKEQGYIKGKEISRQRAELEGYKKTIELIDGRIEQMGLYVSTRSSILQKSSFSDVLVNVLEFKYENLKHTLDYVRVLWKMTRQYVDSAIALFNEINQTSTKNAVNTLTIISSIGMVSVLLTGLSRAEIPIITQSGVFTVLLMVSISFFIHKFINYIFKSLRYKISEPDLRSKLD